VRSGSGSTGPSQRIIRPAPRAVVHCSSGAGCCIPLSIVDRSPSLEILHEELRSLQSDLLHTAHLVGGLPIKHAHPFRPFIDHDHLAQLPAPPNISGTKPTSSRWRSAAETNRWKRSRRSFRDHFDPVRHPHLRSRGRPPLSISRLQRSPRETWFLRHPWSSNTLIFQPQLQ